MKKIAILISLLLCVCLVLTGCGAKNDSTPSANTATETKTESKAEEAKTDEAKVSGHVLKSAMVGVAYLSPEPGAKPFVHVGDNVKAGDTVALVEAMKTFNPIKSDIDGVVKEILVTDGTAIEFDTPIAVIEQVSNDAD